MKKMGLWCFVVILGSPIFEAFADDYASTIATLVQEDISAIKGHCGSLRDSKVFTYVMQEINKKRAIPGFADRHDFELQQLTTDTTNYNEIYKTLCNNGGIQANIFSALIIENETIDPYVPLREQALNVVVEQLQALMSYTR